MAIEMETARRANKPPILITGAHRSGTTWVGRILAASSEVGLIYEPFNITSNRPGVCNHKFENWFQYLSSSDHSPYRHVFDQTLSFKYSIRNEISALKTLRDVGRMARDWGKFSYYRFSHKRPVIKDPIALLSAPWLYNEFQCQVVLLVRHPAAFASSLKRLNWPFNFKYLLNQNALMNDYLGDYREEIEVFKDPSDVIGQAALLWKVLYS
ncbi:MAG: sulfotransferase, partial [Nitrososphaera sp.]|nr:sulfotransferase [Nitrososphaera sp.]